MQRKGKENTTTIPFQGNLKELIVQALLEKKGEDISVIDMRKIGHVLFDYFVICTGNSKPHVETLTDYVQEVTRKEANIKVSFAEGLDNGEWVLLDYFNIIVHVFQPEARNFYNLEQLWNDADIQRF